MTTEPDHAARRDRVRERLERAGLYALYVTDLVNIRWATGFTGTNAQLLVSVDAFVDVFVTDGRYRTQAEAQVPDLERVIRRHGADEAVADRVAGFRPGATVGFEADRLDWSAAERLRRLLGERGVDAAPARGHIEALRAVKDEHELSLLATACALTDTAFDALLTYLRPGRTERDVAVHLERTMVDLGADGPAFDTIVASGPNSAIPHHRPTRRELAAGDLVKVDFGARYRGYHADMTRTVALGEPPDELRDVHEVVRAAQAAGVAAARAGTVAGDVDAACRELVAAAGHGPHFLHGTGHGVGLEIHERPAVAAGAGDRLEAGMTVTVEPGVYLAGRGGVRIEDTVAITRTGPPQVLTRSPRELLVL